ncbi:ORF6N domain-containing protein [Parabacteroides sp. AF17-28]|uniref:ORF6N domain-containing protein n=1 Tax=Parabacteroides sp. AF17-28 TaxID=2292241 RepID=UPI000EFECD4B|nr:ORF6N domain-containing protein [Parabacteroides sp. AF17-28]RHR52141.1 ORF6N domain-containing protein [Parabacteroides sp. AF17-28]
MELQVIQNKIYEIRGQRVMLDFDLAELYVTETRLLKRAVRRNMDRFPEDFMFELTKEEANNLLSNRVSQNGTPLYNFSAYAPFAFTQEGIAMLSSVLRSPIAIQVNINIMRAFVKTRQYILESNQTAKELAELKLQLRFLQEDLESLSKDHESYEQHFDDIYMALAELANRNKGKENKPRNRIGYV